MALTVSISAALLMGAGVFLLCRYAGLLLHAQALLRSTPEGATAYLQADLRDPGGILDRAASLLDFGQPVAVMLLGVLHLIQDGEDPWGIVARLMAAMPPGSYLTISHPAIDIHQSQANAQRVYNERVATPQTLRTREQVARFFAGLELVEPGLVQVHQWRPGPVTPPRRGPCPRTAPWRASPGFSVRGLVSGSSVRACARDLAVTWSAPVRPAR